MPASLGSPTPSVDRMGKPPSAAMLRAKKTQKKGMKFTVMLCGPSGCGKSTFINTICGREVVSKLSKPVLDAARAHEDPGLEIVTIAEDLPDDRNGLLTVKFIDTPGFADNMDNRDCFKQLSDYIEQQFDQVLAEESRIRRNPKFTDNRVHALVYFVLPTGHGLRECDVEFMRLMSTKVNVIPVISKADSLTVDELQLNKRLIMEDIEHFNIPIYNFPTDSDVEEDSDEADVNQELRSLLPFAIIGGSQWMSIKGRSTMVRQYPWGVVDINDTRVCDVSTLSEVLLQTHLVDLKEMTHGFLYENYRTEKLSRDPEESQQDHTSANTSVKSPAVNNGKPLPAVAAAAAAAGMKNSVSTTAVPSSGGGGTLHVDKNAGSNGYRSASASYVLREEQMRQEEEKLKSIETRVQEEIAKKREDLLKREEELRNLEVKLQAEAKQLQMKSQQDV